jgi:hypothetical protein
MHLEKYVLKGNRASTIAFSLDELLGIKFLFRRFSYFTVAAAARMAATVTSGYDSMLG